MPTDLMRSERAPEGFASPGLASMAGQLGALWNRQSRGRQLVALLLLLGVGAGFAYVVLAEREPLWATVVTAHRDDEARECVAVLQRAGVTVRANGRDIDVPPSELAVAREALVAEGLPDVGVGLRSFAEPSFMSSAFGEQVSYKRALQEELERSIKGLAPVESARVHLALGRSSLFKDRAQRPSASVVLRLRPGHPLDAAAVRGVRQLVVGSVEGMATEDVAVIDHLGNLLDGEARVASDERTAIEEAVSGKVRGLLERVVGAGHAVVVASAEMDLREVEETAEHYPREVEPGSGAAGMTGMTGMVAAPGATGATAGVTQLTASGGAAAPQAPHAPHSHVVTETRFPASRLRRLHLAVVVDYKRGPDGSSVAPSADELARWTQLVRSAAGIDDSRGDRVELQAAPLAPVVRQGSGARTVVVAAAGLPPWRLLAMGAAALLAATLLGQMWLRRRYARRLEAAAARTQVLEQQAAASERRALEVTQASHALQAMHAAASATGGAAAAARRPAAERASEAVRRDLDGAAMVLAAWLGGEAKDRADRGEREAEKGALS